MLTQEDLPDDITALKRIIADMARDAVTARAEIVRLNHAATGSPITKEALDRIGQLYRFEETIKGLSPDHRRRERQQRSKPIAAVLATWADEIARKLFRKSELAGAFRYMRARRLALGRCFDGGRLAHAHVTYVLPCQLIASVGSILTIWKIWRTRRDSNSRPLPSEGSALSS